MPIKQEAIHESPNDALALCGPLCLELLKFSDPLFTDCVVDSNFLLFVEVVMASVVWRDLADFLYVLEERDEARPSDGAGCGVPVLNIMNGMHRDKLLGLIDGREVRTDSSKKATYRGKVLDKM